MRAVGAMAEAAAMARVAMAVGVARAVAAMAEAAAMALVGTAGAVATVGGGEGGGGDDGGGSDGGGSDGGGGDGGGGNRLVEKAVGGTVVGLACEPRSKEVDDAARSQWGCHRRAW